MPCTPGTESPWLWFPGLVHPVPQTKSTARCAPPGLVPGHMKGDTLHLSLLDHSGELGGARVPHSAPPPPARAHQDARPPVRRAPTRTAPTSLLSRTRRCSQLTLPGGSLRPRYRLRPPFLSFILSSFLHFPSYSYPSQGLDTYRSLLLLSSPTSSLRSLRSTRLSCPHFLRRPFLLSSAPQTSQSDGARCLPRNLGLSLGTRSLPAAKAPRPSAALAFLLP